MTEQEAKAQVVLLGATEARPALSDGDVDTVLARYLIADDQGRVPLHPDYVPTWDLNGAIGEVWSIKAGRVAGDYSFSADGASYNKGDVLAHCLEMQAYFQGRATGSLGTINVLGTNSVSTLDSIAAAVIP